MGAARDIGDAFSDLNPLDVLGLGATQRAPGFQDTVDQISGKAASDAAEESAELLAAAGTDQVANLRQAQIEAAARQQPFEQFGTEQGIGQLPGLFQQQQDAINNPTGVLNNEFFQAMARDQEQRLLNIRGAGGKGFSGGTQDALARQQLLLGNQFSQQNIGNIQGQIQNQFNAATIGQNAASQTGTQGLQTAGNVGGVLGNIANAQAAGIIGQQQAGTAGLNNILGIGSLIAAPFTGGASLGAGGGLSFLGGGSASPPPANSGFQFA